MECKRLTDGRKLDKKSKEVLRLRVVQQVQNGANPEALARTLDINPRTVYRWLEKFNKGGIDALMARPIPGRPPKLAKQQMEWLSSTIHDNRPSDIGLRYGLWTVELIRVLIEKEFDVKLSDVSVGRVLNSMGIHALQPLQRAYRRSPVLVSRWRKYEQPMIQKRAREENALVWFVEEAEFKPVNLAGASAMGSAGKYQRPPESTLSAVSSRRQFHFMLHSGQIDERVFCEFIERVVEGEDQRIFLILEATELHRCGAVGSSLSAVQDKLEPFFLPDPGAGFSKANRIFASTGNVWPRGW